ncbi:hypothetical protein [Neorhizobium sp. NCHU2750]|uniref:hypothetical protein n=1 Tax=Neorhizobium sp. NCHU2750 TaxID=1825976 RepID=UPI0013C40A88
MIRFGCAVAIARWVCTPLDPSVATYLVLQCVGSSFAYVSTTACLCGGTAILVGIVIAITVAPVS